MRDHDTTASVVILCIRKNNLEKKNNIFFIKKIFKYKSTK